MDSGRSLGVLVVTDHYNRIRPKRNYTGSSGGYHSNGRINVCGFLILVYGHLFFLLPKYFEKEKYVQYAVWGLFVADRHFCNPFFCWLGIGRGNAIGGGKTFTPTYFGSMFLSESYFSANFYPIKAY
ncbi:MAG: hypothetical protein R2788_00620 [Saprospiraceae bacterium]